MHYRAVGNRCAVYIPSLQPPIADHTCKKILSDLGFSFQDLAVVNIARNLIGKAKYKLGSDLDEAPLHFDCSSFTKYLYGLCGVWIPRMSIQQRRFGVVVSEPKAGDLVFTTGHRNFYEENPEDTVGHVGIFTDKNTVIHASDKNTGITESSEDDFYRRSRRGIRRVVVPGTFVVSHPRIKIETSDDLRWLVLKHL